VTVGPLEDLIEAEVDVRVKVKIDTATDQEELEEAVAPTDQVEEGLPIQIPARILNPAAMDQVPEEAEKKIRISLLIQNPASKENLQVRNLAKANPAPQQKRSLAKSQKEGRSANSFFSLNAMFRKFKISEIKKDSRVRPSFEPVKHPQCLSYSICK